jgi:hypothetical protein
VELILSIGAYSPSKRLTGGPIYGGNRVALRTVRADMSGGDNVCADGGGGGEFVLKRQSIGPEETFEFYTDAGLWMWLDPYPDFNQVRPREYTVGLVDMYTRAPVPAKVTVKYLDQSTSMPVDFTTEANTPFRLSFANLAQGQRKTYVPTIRLEVQKPAHSWVGPEELRVNNYMESLYKMVGYGIEPDPDPDPYRFIR